jgi:histidyl-tRNA synthetase
MANPNAKQGLIEMGLLFPLLSAYKVVDKVFFFFNQRYIAPQNLNCHQVSFDLSLARGLDYYTGIIYEVVVEASAPPGLATANALASSASNEPTTAPAQKKKPKAKAAAEDEDEIDESQVGVGSIAAGGRYDDLVGMFTAAAAGEGKKGSSLPCVGISIGLDRVFALLWPKWVEKGMRSKETMVYVMAAGDGLIHERVRLAQELREAGIKVLFFSYLDLAILAVLMATRCRRISSQRTSPNFLLSSRRARRTKCPLLSSLAVTSSRKGLSP